MAYTNNEKGQAAVELALVLPLLIFLILAIMEGGRIFASYMELQHVARESARYAAIHSVSETQLKEWTRNKLVVLDKTKLTNANITFTRHTPHNPNEDKWVEISLNYPLEIITPVISNILGNVFTIKSKMTMISE